MTEALLVVMIVTAILALTVRDLLASVVLAGVFSLLTCLLLINLAAPDVALTEAAVGTGIGSVVLVWAVFRTQRRVHRETDS